MSWGYYPRILVLEMGRFLTADSYERGSTGELSSLGMQPTPVRMGEQWTRSRVGTCNTGSWLIKQIAAVDYLRDGARIARNWGK